MADKIDREAFNFMTTAADKTAVDFSGRKSRVGMKDIHNTLGVAGMIPGIGNVADVLDAALYGMEGDKYGAGLSLIAAIPAFGLMAGGLKVKKGVQITKTLDTHADMVEKAQDVVKAYGKDPLDANLVSDVTDTMADAAQNLVNADKQMGTLLDKGMDFEEALDVMMYYDSKSSRAMKASKDLADMGMSEIDMWGKEAVKEMEGRIKRGAQLALEDAISGKYGFAKLLGEK